MITEKEIWETIDLLAYRNKKNLGDFATMCGLDKSAFRPSTRLLYKVKPRTPSLKTVLKICSALNMSLSDFARTAENATR